MQVTVLMAVFNAEKFLRDSISSLLQQTNNNWKLICIDDGSTDNSLKIIQEYCSKDERITYIKQKNAGPAVARARAIELVNTEYVSILDSDDAYSPNYIELMLNRAEETKADIIVPDVEFGYGNTTKLPNMFIQNNLSPDLIIKNGIEAFSMTIPWKLHGWQMIKTELAQKYYTIKEASYSKFNSDEYITRLLYLKSHIVALCPAKYLYRIDDQSLTRTPSIKKLDYFLTIDKLITLCYKENIPVNIIIRILNSYYSTIKSMIKLSNQLNQNDKSLAIQKIKKVYHNSYRPNLKYSIIKYAPIKSQLKFLLSYLSFYTFKLI